MLYIPSEALVELSLLQTWGRYVLYVRITSFDWWMARHTDVHITFRQVPLKSWNQSEDRGDAQD
jgi:hypothetical protein